MKIFLRISYAFIIAGILAFVNFDIERREVNNFYHVNGKKAVTNNDYCFFYKFIGWHPDNSDPVFQYANHDFEINAYEIYLDKRITGSDPDKFEKQNIIIFLKLLDTSLYKNKFFYLVFTNGEKIVAEPLKITTYKAVSGLMTANFTSGDVIIPISYFKSLAKDAKFAHILTENKGYHKDDKLDDASGKITTDFTYMKTNLKIKDKYEELHTNGLRGDKLEKELESYRIYPPSLFFISQNVKDIRITFSLFYVSFAVLLTYAIFFLPNFIRQIKKTRQILCKKKNLFNKSL